MKLKCISSTVETRALAKKLGMNEPVLRAYAGLYEANSELGLEETLPDYDTMLDFIVDKAYGNMTSTQKKERKNIIRNIKTDEDGNLLADNGKKSNLEFSQYVEVRTQAFKDWFGDWQNPTIFTALNVDDVNSLKKKYAPVHPNEYYHHSTVKYGKQKFDVREGTKSRLHIVGRLTTDKVDALVVENPNSANEIAHITLSTAEGVRPVESNTELKNNRDKIVPLDDYVDTTFTNNLDRNVSKVVDENGEPLVVYHGSRSQNKFNVFDASKGDKSIGSNTSNSELFTFFTNNKDVANVYVNNVEIGKDKGNLYPTFINIRNPKIINFNGFNWDGSGISAEYYSRIFKEWIQLKDELGNTAFPTISDAIKAYRRKFNNGVITDNDFRTSSFSEKSTNEVAEDSLNEGYDGVIISNVGEIGQGSGAGTLIANDYVIFKPNQVKSATDNNGEYSKTNNNIHFRKTENGEFKWAVNARNGFEVTTANKGLGGNYSAKNAKFAEGTKFFGEDVSGMTIEDVYQKIAKRSEKGQAPADDSMIHSWRDYLEDAHAGDDSAALALFEDYPELYNAPQELIQKMHQAVDGNDTLTEADKQDISYYMAYLPLYRIWAEQNKKAMEDLREAAAGKTITDKFAIRTRVTQARALADLLNESQDNKQAGVTEAPTTTIISGGQTGVDTIGLQVGRELGLETGGTAPKGYLREQGYDNEDIASYGLKEISDEDQADYTRRTGKKDPYTARTELNVRNSDGTVYFSTEADTRGKIATKRAVDQYGKPFLENPTADELRQWLIDNNIKTLNVAGNRGSKLDKDNKVAEILREALKKDSSVQQNTVSDNTPESLEVDTTKKLSAFERANRAFTPIERKQAKEKVARAFSEEVSVLMQETLDEVDRRIGDAQTQQAKAILERMRKQIDRRWVIDKRGVPLIMERVKNNFQSYLDYANSSTAELIERDIKTKMDELNEWLNEMHETNPDNYDDVSEYDQYVPSEKEIREKIEQRVEAKKINYQKIIDNMEILAYESSDQLAVTEGIVFEYNGKLYNASYEEVAENEEKSISEETKDGAQDKEEQTKDHWTIRAHSVSQYESIGVKTRRLLNNIEMTDASGYPMTDAVGDAVMLNPATAHAVLLKNMKDMTKPEEMMDMIQKLGEVYNWANQVYDELMNDNQLMAQFYHDFRKAFLKMTAQIRTSKGMVAKNLNTDVERNVLMQNIKNAIDSHYFFSDTPIYNTEGGIDNHNAEIIHESLEPILHEFNKLLNRRDKESDKTRKSQIEDEALEYLQNNEVLETLHNALNALGISEINYDTLINLSAVRTTAEVRKQPLINLLQNTFDVVEYIHNGKAKNSVNKDGNIVWNSPLTEANKPYRNISFILDRYLMDSNEDSFNERNKSYYSYGNPSFFQTLVTRLKKPSVWTEEQYQKWLNEEYLKYDWFKSEGNIDLDILTRLMDPKDDIRLNIDFKQVLHFQRHEIAELQGADYTFACITEFNIDNNKNYGWYALPVESNATVAEFMKLPKYSEQYIKEKLHSLVIQEHRRISLVKARDAARRGGKNIPLIDNWDITRKKDGSIDSYGGSKYKFLPALNDYRTAEGTFEEGLNKLLNRKAKEDDIKKYIATALDYVLEDMFEKSLQDMYSKGLYSKIGNEARYPGMTYSYNNYIKNALNSAKSVLDSAWTAEMEEVKIAVQNDKYIDHRTLSNVTGKIKDALSTLNVNPKISQSLDNMSNVGRDNYRHFWFNNVFAKNTIIQLSTTDLAQYKNIVDFYKRFKEVHAPGTKLYTLAKWGDGENAEIVGKQYERTITIEDNEIGTNIYDHLKHILQEKVDAGQMKKMDMDFILSKYADGKINETDGQSYRTLKSFRSLMIMKGDWSQEQEDVYQKFQRVKNGEESYQFDMNDFQAIFMPIKPYVFTNNVAVESGVNGFGDIKTSVQHKNSESIMLAAYEFLAGVTKKSEKMAALDEWMEENDIDVVHFGSVVKVGGKGKININDVSSKEDVKARLDAIKMPDGTFDRNYMTEINYEDYYIQNEVPEHLIDAIQLFGSQVRKLGVSDLPENAEIVVNGKSYTKKDLLKHYQSLVTANIKQSFEEVSEIFSDPKRLEAELQHQIATSNRYDKQLALACTLNEDGNFNIPLTDPIQSQRVQELLNSIIKNRVGKQKIKGGALVQVSSFGYTDDLNVVFKTKDGKEITYRQYIKENPNGNEEKFNAWRDEQIKSGNLSVAYLECYMPAYSEDMIKAYIDPKTGEIDINKIPDNLKQLIGYRIPTENKYSILPLKIKGFLPQYYGSSIMMPAEITTMTGSDFDIDKMYIMLPEADAHFNYDKDAARRDYNDTFHENIDEISDEEFMKIVMNQTVDSSLVGFNDWFQANKDEYQTGGTLHKVRYETHKDSIKGRNNEILDIIWSVMTNHDTASKLMSVGGFEDLKKDSRIMGLMMNFTYEELCREFKCKKSELLDVMQSKSEKELNRLLSSKQDSLSPLDQTVQDNMLMQNMSGVTLVGTYAVHNASHAFIQNTELSLARPFVFNGKEYKSLHNINNEDNEPISKYLCQYVAAAVDNAKDPILAQHMQNEFTAPITMLMVRMGIKPIEIAAFMNQPIVRKAAVAIVQNGSSGAESIIKGLINEYKNAAGDKPGRKAYFKERGFLLSDMLDAIQAEKDIDVTRQSTYMDAAHQSFTSNQMNVGYKLLSILKINDEFRKILAPTRADSQSNMAGPTIADNLNSIMKTEQATNYGYIYLDNNTTNFIIPNKGLSEDDVAELLENDPIAIQNAYQYYGILKTQELLGKYFHYFDPNIMDAIKQIGKFTPSGSLNKSTIKTLLSDIDTYLLLSLPEFRDDAPESKDLNGEYGFQRPMTADEKAEYYTNQFINDFISIKSKHPEIAKLDFIKHIEQFQDQNSGVKYLGLTGNATLNKTTKDNFMRDWESLLYMDDPVAHQLAFELLKYGFYRKGFGFGNKTFTHLCPITIKMQFPGYIERLRNLKELATPELLKPFIEQFIRNHMTNQSLVSPVRNSLEYVDLSSKNIPDFFTPSEKDEILISERRYDSQTQQEIVIFKPYVALHFEAGVAYYKQVYYGDGSPTYVRIYPLGLKNNVTEYYLGIYEPVSRFKANQKLDTQDNLDDSDADDGGYTGEGLVPEVQSSTVVTTLGMDSQIAQQTGIETMETSDIPTDDELNFLDDEGNELCNGIIMKEL